jgi:hypothetical protein
MLTGSSLCPSRNQQLIKQGSMFCVLNRSMRITAAAIPGNGISLNFATELTAVDNHPNDPFNPFGIRDGWNGPSRWR